MIFVSHDREFANRLATHVWAVGGGTMTAHRGNLDDFLWDRAVAAGVASRRAPGESAPNHWLLQGLPEGADAGSGPLIDGGSATAEDVGRDAWKDRKKRAAELRSLERRAEELMETIEALDHRIAALDAELAAGEAGWEQIAETARLREEAGRESGAAWAEWEAIDAELGTEEEDAVS